VPFVDSSGEFFVSLSKTAQIGSLETAFSAVFGGTVIALRYVDGGGNDENFNY
jgi:hypothetical protein